MGNGSNGATPNGDGKPAPLPKRRRRHNNVRLAAIVLAVMVPALYLGFTKDVPFTSGFQVSAVFKSANSIRLDSPVRIAGINVGKVVSVTRYGNTDSAKVTMEIDDTGLPIHTDAQLKIRPRIFLEGNFFVDLAPGTPTAPTVPDGGVIPVTQTATPVQLDQVLTSLQYDTRGNLQTLLREVGVAFDTKPTPEENAQIDPEVRDTTGGQALNRSLKYSAEAEKGQALVNQGLLGLNNGDLAGFIRGLAKTTSALSKNELVLADFVTNFNGTMEALGSDQQSLSKAIGLLGPTVTNTYKALGSLNAALPSIDAFTTALLPGVNQTLATTNAGIPWATQMNRLLPPVNRTLSILAPTTRATARTVASQIEFLPQTRALAQCFAYSILPTGDQVIKDANIGGGYPFSTGEPAYKSFWFSMVGMAGESQNYDGNGQFIRAQVGGAERPGDTGPSNPGHLLIDMNENNAQFPAFVSPVFGNMPNEPLGQSPRYFGRYRAPDYKPGTSCIPQDLPSSGLPSDANLMTLGNDPSSANPYLVDLNKASWSQGKPDPVAP